LPAGAARPLIVKEKMWRILVMRKEKKNGMKKKEMKREKTQVQPCKTRADFIVRTRGEENLEARKKATSRRKIYVSRRSAVEKTAKKKRLLHTHCSTARNGDRRRAIRFERR